MKHLNNSQLQYLTQLKNKDECQSNLEPQQKRFKLMDSVEIKNLRNALHRTPSVPLHAYDAIIKSVSADSTHPHTIEGQLAVRGGFYHEKTAFEL